MGFDGTAEAYQVDVVEEVLKDEADTADSPVAEPGIVDCPGVA